MGRIVVLLVAAGVFGCAATPVLPPVEAGADPRTRAAATRLLPSEPEASWHVAPSGQGAAVELRF
jgi:hypothetical protein